MPVYALLFIVVFVIGILSGFGLGSLLLWITYGKRIKALFIVACEVLERFDFLIESLSEQDDSESDTNEVQEDEHI